MRILITNGEGVAGAVIRWWTWSWAAHAALMLDDGWVLDATPAHGVSIHRTVSGDVRRVFRVKCEREVEAGVARWAAGQVGKPYDWSAIAGIPFRRNWRQPGEWFCSELVASAFEAAAFPLLRTSHLNRVTPRDLLLSPYLVECPAQPSAPRRVG